MRASDIDRAQDAPRGGHADAVDCRMSQTRACNERQQALLARIAGLVLAGGRSSRFGAEKAVAPFRGRPLMAGAVAALSDLPCIAVSAKPLSGAAHRAREWDIPVVVDDKSAPSGPLAGVAAGLEWAWREGFDVLATAPCDAPLLPGDLVLRLAEQIGDAPAAYAVTAHGEHPLCALWRVELRERLTHCLAAGEHPPARAFLKAVGAAPVHFKNADAFANTNTADALAALERRR